jgi:hypothetical protein
MCGVTTVPEALGTPLSGTFVTSSVSIFEGLSAPFLGQYSGSGL